MVLLLQSLLVYFSTRKLHDLFSSDHSKLIVKGVASEYNSHPWFASLFNSTGFRYCGSTIIGERWVLTAAHCAERLEDGSLLVVAQGGKKEDERSYKIRNIIMHENYSSDYFHSDIAILETEGDIAFNDHVQPIRLADNDLEVGASATAIGYGITETGNMSDQLLEKTARISAPDNCTNGPVFDGHSMICFGSGDGNVCGGDSGGPLLKEDDYGETWQYGVANFLTSPDHTCHKAYPTSFARVSVYCEWIKDKTNQEVLCGHNPDM
ncbi:hypothetical protein QR680_006329 [Steinernema hermaphroditum]|uniref:Peptidase S1 domain-containing protein n=1 Tax=Steinernema hermaphroditum TaxID=289476 RepID=A0AA39HWH7_9BILA|nr:hypothetical protein QR680_006329 [Steinernema hermaphroditum]